EFGGRPLWARMGRAGPLRVRRLGATVLVPCEPADHYHGARGTHGSTPGGQPLVSGPARGRAARGKAARGRQAPEALVVVNPAAGGSPLALAAKVAELLAFEGFE